MTRCPECRHESLDGVDACPHCGTVLIPGRLAPDATGSGRGHEPLVHIATAPDEVLASLWKGILEEEGIPSLIRRSDLTAAMYVLPGNTQCEIHVLASEASRARDILDSLQEVDQHPSEE